MQGNTHRAQELNYFQKFKDLKQQFKSKVFTTKNHDIHILNNPYIQKTQFRIWYIISPSTLSQLRLEILFLKAPNSD